MQLVLQIQHPGEWESLMTFLTQRGIAFMLTGKNNGQEISQSQTATVRRRKPRRAGFSKAKFFMSPDFNAPLDDFAAYMP